MYYFGYHRVSTKEQNEDRGVNAIKKFCFEKGFTLHPDNKVFTDKHTGKEYDNRPGYNRMKSMLRSGDTVIFDSLDRVGRTKDGVLAELRYFKNNNIRFMVLNNPYTLMDPPNKEDKVASIVFEMVYDVIINVFASVSELETEMRADRQRAGIEAMKAGGDWDKYGRPRSVEFEEFEKYYRNVWLGKQKPFECMKMLGLKKSTFYRYKQEYEKKHGKQLPVFDITENPEDMEQALSPHSEQPQNNVEESPINLSAKKEHDGQGDKEVVAVYLDKLRRKLQMLTSFQTTQSETDTGKQWDAYLSSLYNKPLSEVQQLTLEFKKSLDSALVNM